MLFLQQKILTVLNRHYDSYSKFHSVNSHKNGEIVRIDLHLSFESGTSPDDIIALRDRLKDEFDSQFENCMVNIIVKRN